MTNFEQAFAQLLTVEGTKFTDFTHDLGGGTKFGIDRATFAAWQTSHPDSAAETIEDLAPIEAGEIYKTTFWDTYSLDQVNAYAVCYAIFDQHVNRGSVVALEVQQVLHNLGQIQIIADGKIGPMTVEALNTIDPVAFVRAFVVVCQDAYRTIVTNDPTQAEFLGGWLNRCTAILNLVGGNGATLTSSSNSNPPGACI